MATKIAATATADATPPEQIMGVPEAVAALGAAQAALEGTKRRLGATGADLAEARGTVELAEAALERARQWEAGEPQRAAWEEAKVHERVLRHNATEGEREIAAAYGQLMAARDRLVRAARSTNNGNLAAMAFIRAKGHLLPEGHADIGGGGVWVRVGEASYCMREEPWINGFIAYHEPLPPAPPAPAQAGCRHLNTFRIESTEARMHGVEEGSRWCPDCQEILPSPGKTSRSGSVVVGPGR